MTLIFDNISSVSSRYDQITFEIGLSCFYVQYFLQRICFVRRLVLSQVEVKKCPPKGAGRVEEGNEKRERGGGEGG